MSSSLIRSTKNNFKKNDKMEKVFETKSGIALYINDKEKITACSDFESVWQALLEDLDNVEQDPTGSLNAYVIMEKVSCYKKVGMYSLMA